MSRHTVVTSTRIHGRFKEGTTLFTGVCPYCSAFHTHDIARVGHDRMLGWRAAGCDPERTYLLVQQGD